MNWRGILAGLLGAFAIAQGLWILVVRADPPTGARTATRKNRQIIGIVQVIVGVFLISLSVSQI